MTNEYAYLLPSAARTATASSVDQINRWDKGAVVTVDVTGNTAGSLIVKVQGKDRVSGKYYDILSSAVILAGPTTQQLRIYPGLTAVTNLTVSDILPEIWRVTTIQASGTITFSVGASLIE